MYRLLCALLTIILFFSCQTNQNSDLLPEVDEGVIRASLAEIASDEYEGRKPFTNGEVKTVAYLENTLKSMGLAPGNGNSYLQEVAMVEIDGEISPQLTLQGHGKTLSLDAFTDYVAVTEQVKENIDIKNSELVFCGYGLVAPEHNKNDYDGVDMKGKIAVVLVNDPGFGMDDDTYFKGNIMTYYGRWTYKYEEAARQGCEGVLIIHETASAGYPWFVVKTGWSGPQLNISSADGNADKCAMEGWISLDAAKELFETAGLDLAESIRDARKADFKPYSLGMEASMSISNKLKRDVSQNVVAKIVGTEKPEETIIYTAHWDHLGIGEPAGTDSIYNGAYDNASGCAALLGVADAMSKSRAKPKRSVVFLFVTAEEQGLLGSKHYVENPIYPLETTVANLNIDGANPFGKMKDLTVVGYGQNELEELAGAIAKEQGRYLLPESEPEKGYYFRSDHFNFAKKGIPALFAAGGYDHWENGKDYAKELHEAYTAKAYHRPLDNYDPEWDLTGMLDDANLLSKLGWQLANELELYPDWKEGSEFKK